MKKITPFLWFNGNAEKAVKYYVSVFKNAKIKKIARYGSQGAFPEGSVMTIVFQIGNTTFTALNGGPQFVFNPAVSFVVWCDDQKEIDRLWKRLSSGGKILACGWLTDRFGLTWQIVPSILPKLLSGSPAKKERVMNALYQMKKLNLKALQDA